MARFASVQGRYLPTFSISLKTISIEELTQGENRRLSRHKYSILSIQFSRKMTRPPSRDPLRPFSQILSLELEYATRAGVTKEKNKFDQSEGGGYRFGYGFRKRRRILFLRKPDKGPFTRIFSHTRRLHLCRYSSKREMRIESQTVYRSIHITIPRQNIFCNIKNL